MGRRFWTRALVGAATAALGAAIGWAGYALLDPQGAGVSALPLEIARLPFEREFWAILLMLLGAATLLKALPRPPWTQRRGR